MVRTIAMVLVMLLGACANNDDGSATCSAPGTATVTGSVMGVEVAPVMRAFLTEVDTGVFGLVIDEQPGAMCDSVSTAGEHIVMLWCGAPSEMTYPVVNAFSSDCPEGVAIAIVERGGGMDVAKASGGSVDMTGLSSSCAIGNYSLEFDGGESLSGTFNAVVCP